MQPSFNSRPHALVTGGAGLIGSHLVDLLVREGWRVRSLDNLEPNTHRLGRPPWLNPHAEFVHGDIRDAATVRAALQNVDVIFHQAAYGGYMPEWSKYVHVNSFGTAQMLELIRDENIPVKKIVVASSQAVYLEGAARCLTHGRVFPSTRPNEQLARGDWEVHCPLCGAVTQSIPTPEDAPVGGETVYAITKLDQERLVLTWGRQTGIATVALRYSCTYGPRQSLFNPYTGVITIFTTRLLNGQSPVLYEDGRQTRDMSFVEDIARANLLAALSDRLDGQPVNIGSGRATTVRDMARLLAEALQIPIEPVARGEFRPGEMRHLTSDSTRAQAIGYAPTVSLEQGVERYLAWIRQQGSVRDYFAAAEEVLRSKRVVQQVGTLTPNPSPRGRGESEAQSPSPSGRHLPRRAVPGDRGEGLRPMHVTLIIPALNEAGAIAGVIQAIPPGVAGRVIVVDNGSTDGTADAARAAGADVVTEPRRGYGYACRAGVLVATDADVVAFMDGDGSFDPAELPRLLAPLQQGQADLVLGSRTLGPGGAHAVLPHARFGNWLTATLMRLLYGVRVTDLGPMRAIRRSLLLSLDMQEMLYGWPTEMMVKSARAKARIVEVPVSYGARVAGVSKVSGTLKGSLRAGYHILRTTFRYIRD